MTYVCMYVMIKLPVFVHLCTELLASDEQKSQLFYHRSLNDAVLPCAGIDDEGGGCCCAGCDGGSRQCHRV